MGAERFPVREGMIPIAARGGRAALLALALGAAHLLSTEAAAFAAPPMVGAVRVDTVEGGSATHVVLESSEPLSARVFTVASPERLIVDLPEVAWRLPTTEGPVNSPMIRGFVFANHMPGASRLVLDLAEAAHLYGYEVKTSPDGRRYYLDISLESAARAAERRRAPAPPRLTEEQEEDALNQSGARRLVEEEIGRITEESRRRAQEEAARLAEIRAAEEARMARIRAEQAAQAAQAAILPPLVAAAPAGVPSLNLAPTGSLVAPPPAPQLVLLSPPAPRDAKTAQRVIAASPRPRLKPMRLPASDQVAMAALPSVPLLDPTPYKTTRIDFSELDALFGSSSRDRDNRAAAAEALRPVGPRREAAPKATLTPSPASRPLVVIDAGHGGKDPGAMRGEIQEKDIVLAFAKALRDKLVASGRYEVQMTRQGDRFVELADRVEAARVINADLLLSIHADWLDAPEVSGATAYLVTEQESGTPLEQVLRGKDSLGRVGGVEIADEKADVARTIIEMARLNTRRHSKDFADRLISELEKVTPVLRRSVRPANYVVLRAPDTPSVLLELGFMSNEADLQRLQSDVWRAGAVDAVTRALDSWRIARATF